MPIKSVKMEISSCPKDHSTQKLELFGGHQFILLKLISFSMHSIIIRISEINRKNNTLIVHPMSSKQLFPQKLITSSLLLYSSLTWIDGFMSLIHSASSVSRWTSPRRVLHTMSKSFSDTSERASHAIKCLYTDFSFVPICSLKRVITCRVVAPT